MSIVIAKRLLKKFRDINPTTQFGHIGCQEALHIVRRAKIMCQILLKYGLPPKLVANISKLYENCQIRIKIGKTYTEVNYSAGVHQGDNMPPILFLFQAFLDMLYLQAQQIQFSHFAENKSKTSKHAKAGY
jgi:hypothetical protein